MPAAVGGMGADCAAVEAALAGFLAVWVQTQYYYLTLIIPNLLTHPSLTLTLNIITFKPTVMYIILDKPSLTLKKPLPELPSQKAITLYTNEL